MDRRDKKEDCEMNGVIKKLVYNVSNKKYKI